MSPARITLAQIAGWLSGSDRLAMAGVALAVGGLQGTARGLPLAGGAGLALAIALIDLRHRKIPDLLNLPSGLLSLLDATLSGQAPERLAPMLALWLVLEGLRLGFLWLRGRDGMGGGDIKLIVAAAAWLLATSLTGLVHALWVRRHGGAAGIPFGAHLAPWLILFALLRPPGAQTRKPRPRNFRPRARPPKVVHPQDYDIA